MYVISMTSACLYAPMLHCTKAATVSITVVYIGHCVSWCDYLHLPLALILSILIVPYVQKRAENVRIKRITKY